MIYFDTIIAMQILHSVRGSVKNVFEHHMIKIYYTALFGLMWNLYNALCNSVHKSMK